MALEHGLVVKKPEGGGEKPRALHLGEHAIFSSVRSAG